MGDTKSLALEAGTFNLPGGGGEIAGFEINANSGDIQIQFRELKFTPDEKNLDVADLSVRISKDFLNRLIRSQTADIEREYKNESKFLEGIIERKREEGRVHKVSLGIDKMSGNSFDLSASARVNGSIAFLVPVVKWEMRKIKTGPITWGKTKVPVITKEWRDGTSASGRAAISATATLEFEDNTTLDKVEVFGKVKIRDLDINIKNFPGEIEKVLKKA